jgi:hypothetical protein
VYRLDFTAAYVADLRRIEGGSTTLSTRLKKGIYLTLMRDPYEGVHHSRLNVWFARQVIIPGLLIVQVVYQIDEGDKMVSLLALEEVHLI